MASTLSDRIQIAVGHDNEAGLQRLDQLSPPLLDEYGAPGGVLTAWKDAEGWRRNGDRVLVPIGRPQVTLRFFALSPDEGALLKTYEGPITARLYNKSTATWLNYNGYWEMDIDDARWEEAFDSWDELEVIIRDLDEIE